MIGQIVFSIGIMNRERYFMKFLIFLMIFFCIAYPVKAEDMHDDRGIEISAGFSMLLYQSVYSFQSSTTFETTSRGHITDLLDWQVGARFGFTPVLPEGFARILTSPEIGRWRPNVGVELGLTNRARFKKGEKLLRETRSAMENEISHIYLAAHSAPLSFMIRDRWRLSMLELQIGTHFGHMGRTVRTQIGIFSLGKYL